MQHYKKTTHRELDLSCSISQVPDSLPNILAITGGVSTRQKEGKEKTQLSTLQKHGAPTHDRDTNAMLRSVWTCNILPRKQARKNSGERWRTFYHFAPYNDAHTKAPQQIKKGYTFRRADSDATHGFLQPPPAGPAVKGCCQKSTFIRKPKPNALEVQCLKQRFTLRPPLPANFKK